MAFSLDPARVNAPVGAIGTTVHVVADTDTAIAAGSGDLPVLATPAMVSLMESAACAALHGHLPHAATSVGTHIDVRHLAPTAVGATVTAHARITSVAGTRVVFEVSATHDLGGQAVEIGNGVHTRVIVDRERFVHSI